MNLNIMKEDTLKEILKATQMNAALLAGIAGSKPGTVTVDDFESVRKIVRAGIAKKIFAIGDQFIVPWTDTATNTVYDLAFDIVHMGDVTLEDDSVVPGMYLQMHYVLPYGITFDAPENEAATESAFLAEYSYYLKNEDESFSLQEVVAGDAIPEGVTYYHSAIKDPSGNICRYGYNRWSHSAYRQWANSSAGKGEWWSPQHLGDVKPGESNSRAGFMSGLPEDFLKVIKPVKNRNVLNTVTDSAIGTYEDTVDTFFLPSKEQVYGTTENGISEGEAWDYYKKTTGFSEPKNNDTVGRIKYRITDHTSAQSWRLRSANRGYGYTAWFVYPGGYVISYYAMNAYAPALACVIA